MSDSHAGTPLPPMVTGFGIQSKIDTFNWVCVESSLNHCTMANKKAFILLLGILLLFLPGQAQTLTGTVRDSHGEGIATASVYIEGTTVGTLTDAPGGFHLDLKPGTYRIAVKMLG